MQIDEHMRMLGVVTADMWLDRMSAVEQRELWDNYSMTGNEFVHWIEGVFLERLKRSATGTRTAPARTTSTRADRRARDPQAAPPRSRPGGRS